MSESMGNCSGEADMQRELDEVMNNPQNLDLRWWCMLLGWSLLPCSLFATCGNLLIILIRRQRSMKSSINLVLLWLAIADLALSLFIPPVFIPPSLLDYYAFVEEEGWDVGIALALSAAIFYPCVNILLTVTTYLMVLVGGERYFAVCRPFQAINFCTIRNAGKGIIAVFAFSILFNLPRFLSFELTTINGTLHVQYRATERLGENYELIYSFGFYFLFVVLIPLTIQGFLSVRIIWAVKDSQKFQKASCGGGEEPPQTSTTFMLLTVLLSFCFSQLLLVGIQANFQITNVKKMIFERRMPASKDCSEKLTILAEFIDFQKSSRRDVDRFLVAVSNILVILSPMLNFPIYYFFSDQFRSGFSRLYGKHFPEEGGVHATGRTIAALYENLGRRLILMDRPDSMTTPSIRRLSPRQQTPNLSVPTIRSSDLPLPSSQV